MMMMMMMMTDSWCTRRRRPQLSIDISCPQGAQQPTNRTRLLLSIDGTDRLQGMQGFTPRPVDQAKKLAGE